MSINKVILVGNVGKDPVIRYFDKGVAKATFPLATSETYTNQQGETITSTEWHNIVLWRALAEVAEKTVKKGSQVYIIGRIKTRSYVDKEGVNKYITEILADTLLPLDRKQQSGYTSAQSGQGKSDPPGSEVNEQSETYASPESDTTDDDLDLENRQGTDQGEDDLPF
jgi:single-strand DNA-binding protein